MQDQFLLTPYFLTEHLPGLEEIAGPDWKQLRIQIPPGRETEQLAVLNGRLRDEVGRILQEGKRPISVAGDCVTTLGVLAGLQQAGIFPTLIWLDAHGDFNTWETTPSGFLGGMPLAMLVGRGEQTIVETLGLSPLPEEQVMLSDARDLDPGEREALAGSGVQHMPNPAELLTMPLPAGPLYVHFDTDILDSADAPAMNYPVPGGPPVELLREVFRRFAASGQVAAVSLSSWNPAWDADGRTAKLCMDLLGELAT